MMKVGSIVTVFQMGKDVFFETPENERTTTHIYILLIFIDSNIYIYI